MAGFFGLFNYEKEGPGISKNAPKKKAFIVFFETFFRNFWKFITINLVYIIMSLPVVTSGLAAAGLTNIARNIGRDKHSFGLSDFFETIKKNWKQALPTGIILAFLYGVLAFDVFFFSTSQNDMFATIGMAITFLFFIILTFMTFFIWTLMITFKFSLKQIFKNSFKFAFINFKKNFLCLLLIVLIHAIYVGIALLLANWFFLVVTVEIIFYILTYPAFKYLLVQFCVFPSIKKYIIDPYYEEHPEEDIDKRRDLGIEVEEKKPEKPEGEDGEDDESENVFED